MLLSDSSNLYGDDVREREDRLDFLAQSTFINTDKPLARGILNEYYLYIAENTDFPDYTLVTICLEIWRPVTGVNMGYTLVYRKEVLVNYSSEEGSLCKVRYKYRSV